jgi:hypothetical protein
MKSIILTTIFSVIAIIANAQADKIDSLLNDLLSNDKKVTRLLEPQNSFLVLYAGTSVENQTFYAGREIGDNMYNINSQLFMFSSKGFYLGVSGIWYSQFEPKYNNTILLAGYYKALNKKRTLAFSTSYSRNFYYQPDTSFEYLFNNNLSTSFTLKNKWIGFRLNTNVLFGKDFGINITPKLFSQITLMRFGKYNSIRFEPEALMLFSSESVEYTSSGYSGSHISDPSVTTKDVYGMLNIQFYLPLAISLGNFEFETGYTVNMPHSMDSNIKYPVTSSISVSLGYMFIF